MADLGQYLHQLLEHRGSDLHLKVGAVAHVRVDGRLVPLVGASLTASDLEAIALSVIPPDRIGEFERCGDLDFAVGLGGVGRFRLNVHRQRGSYGIVVRCVPPGLPTWEQLGLPASIRRLAEHTAGLILIGGPAGSGRSTTAAMLVDQVNSSRAARVVTIENPIEVLHADKRSIISQREVGGDTPSFVEGLQRLLRQDCDVVYVSEVSDASTAAEVFTVAQSGRLVIAVVTATSVESAINRYVDFFPDLEQQVVRRDLASCLRGVSAQKLLERADGLGRVPAVEIFVSTSRGIEAIVDPTGSRESLERVMREGHYNGMQTADQHLQQLVVEGRVQPEVALRVATTPEELRIELRRSGVSKV